MARRVVHKLQRFARVFSGENSKALWDDIHRVKKKHPKVFWAFYSLGCKCQELESIVRQLEERVAELEDE